MKEYRVCMEPALIVASSAADAIAQVREGIGLDLYAEETGLTQDDSE